MAKKSARKEITKINLKQATLEGLSYERACETAKRAGKPSYRFRSATTITRFDFCWVSCTSMMLT